MALGIIVAALLFTGQSLNAPKPVSALCLTCFATLTADLSGDGTGRVTSDDGYIDCRRDGGSTVGTCQHTYPIPSGPITVQLTAHPDTNSFYCNRVDLPRTCDGPGQADTGGYSFDTNKTVGLAFVLVQRSVVVGIAGPGLGSVVSPEAGIACPGTCQGSVPVGTQVTLTASAMPGWAFAGWSGTCAGQGFECSVTATDPVDTNVYFGLATLAPPTAAPPTARPTATPRHSASPTATPRDSTSAGSPGPTLDGSAAPSASSLTAGFSPNPDPTKGGGESGAPWLVVILLVIVLLAGAGAGWLVARRRRGQSS